MRLRCVTLPVFGLLSQRVQKERVAASLLRVPGVANVWVNGETETLELLYDPTRCGSAQLLSAIEAIGAARENDRTVAGAVGHSVLSGFD